MPKLNPPHSAHLPKVIYELGPTGMKKELTECVESVAKQR